MFFPRPLGWAFEEENVTHESPPGVIFSALWLARRVNCALITNELPLCKFSAETKDPGKFHSTRRIKRSRPGLCESLIRHAQSFNPAWLDLRYDTTSTYDVHVLPLAENRWTFSFVSSLQSRDSFHTTMCNWVRNWEVKFFVFNGSLFSKHVCVLFLNIARTSKLESRIKFSIVLYIFAAFL